MGLEDTPNVTPVFNSALDCYHHPEFDPTQGYMRETVEINGFAWNGGWMPSPGNIGGSITTSVAVCQPTIRIIEDIVGSLVNKPAQPAVSPPPGLMQRNP